MDASWTCPRCGWVIRFPGAVTVVDTERLRLDIGRIDRAQDIHLAQCNP